MSLGLMLAVLPLPPPAHEPWIVVGTTDYNSQRICGNGTVKYPQTKMHMYRVKCTVPLIYDELLRLQPAYPKDVINIFKGC